jgi:Protein of unknown function (DUF1566)
MKLLALGLIVLGMVAFGTTLAGAQTTAPGPYYATPSWDQTLPSSTRFIVLSNFGSAAVLDRETGLVWERSPSTTWINWYDARTYCNSLILANRMGWRLPTIQELASLVDPSVPFPGPTLPSGHPFTNVPDAWTWSANSQAVNGDSSVAWVVDFQKGIVTRNRVKTIKNYDTAWCVRGGHGVDPQ